MADKYKIRPIVVEATQWFKHGDHSAVYRYAIVSKIISEDPFVTEPEEWAYELTVRNDDNEFERIHPGYWIVKMPDGKIMAYSPESFEHIFEKSE